MEEDASLDDFATGSGVRERDGEHDGEREGERAAATTGETVCEERSGGGEAESPEAIDDGTTEPSAAEHAVVPTSSWRPGGRCERCGDRAARRWRDGDRLACVACAGWE